MILMAPPRRPPWPAAGLSFWKTTAGRSGSNLAEDVQAVAPNAVTMPMTAGKIAVRDVVMAITKCLIGCRFVKSLTAALKAFDYVWPHQRADGPLWMEWRR